MAIYTLYAHIVYIYMCVLFIVLFMVNSLPMIEKVPDMCSFHTGQSRTPFAPSQDHQTRRMAECRGLLPEHLQK